jgi:hypothetical protein
MTIGHLTSREQTKVIKATSATNDVRTLIADHLGVSVRRVTDDAHLTDMIWVPTGSTVWI